MKYGSVCSGIEAASCAWHPLSWSPAFFAEIEPFPSAVLKHHWSAVPNLGDFTKIKEKDVEPIELLVGGTPCQSFSVAGKRLGLDDPRGNLALEYLALARRLRPRWLVFENVPGLLSSDEGRDFGAFLGLLGECGYGWAYRVLDAQYVRVDGHARAVPQRRQRVFVVGHLGDWRPAAAVLFEPEGLRGDSPPRREAGAGIAEGAVSRALSRVGGGDDPGANKGAPIVPVAFGGNNTEGSVDVATACRAKGGTGHGDFESEAFVTEVADPISASEDKTYSHEGKNNFRLHNCVAFTCKDHGADAAEESAPTLRAMGHDKTWENGGGQVAVLAIRGRDGEPTLEVNDDGAANAVLTPNGGRRGIGVGAIMYHSAGGVVQKDGDISPTIDSARESRGTNQQRFLADAAAVRRLTPRECERLQGFPDDYTLVPYRGKPAADGPRYKALGNSMACNVMAWIGRRIQLFESCVSVEIPNGGE